MKIMKMILLTNLILIKKCLILNIYLINKSIYIFSELNNINLLNNFKYKYLIA